MTARYSDYMPSQGRRSLLVCLCDVCESSRAPVKYVPRHRAEVAA